VISSLTQTAISNYFSPPHQEFIAPPSSPPRSPQYTSQQLGTIIIRSLSSSSSPAPLTNSLSSPPSSLHYQQTLNKTYPIVSHFKPHTSPINILTFNPAGDLLVSSDTGGNTVYVWRINDPVICLHKLVYTNQPYSFFIVSWDNSK
jgi:WD40 repeat protein